MRYLIQQLIDSPSITLPLIRPSFLSRVSCYSLQRVSLPTYPYPISITQHNSYLITLMVPKTSFSSLNKPSPEPIILCSMHVHLYRHIPQTRFCTNTPSPPHQHHPSLSAPCPHFLSSPEPPIFYHTPSHSRHR